MILPCGWFRRRAAPLAIALALALVDAQAQSRANDTVASLNAGGLVFEKSVAIQMKSEVLSISPGGVEVDYVFATPTVADIITAVAFPLPDLKLADMAHSPSSVPFRGEQNYLGFKTCVNGKEIALERLVRADEEEWCTDDAHKAAFAKLPKHEAGYLPGKAVRYVLSTGANWSGPIGAFTLKVDKAGAALVSTCAMDGLNLKREGEGEAFAARAKDFTPKANLNILFVFAGPK